MKRLNYLLVRFWNCLPFFFHPCSTTDTKRLCNQLFQHLLFHVLLYPISFKNAKFISPASLQFVFPTLRYFTYRLRKHSVAGSIYFEITMSTVCHTLRRRHHDPLTEAGYSFHTLPRAGSSALQWLVCFSRGYLSLQWHYGSSSNYKYMFLIYCTKTSLCFLSVSHIKPHTLSLLCPFP